MSTNELQELAIYTRDESGLISGPRYEKWHSKAQALEYYCRDDRPVEHEPLKGWPHEAAEWHGSLGFGLDGDESSVYRFDRHSGSLYERQGNAYVHCHRSPSARHLIEAIREYEDSGD